MGRFTGKENRYSDPGRIALLLAFALPLLSLAVLADDGPFFSALSKGKFDFSSRYRFEHVDDDAVAEAADASTLRTTLGYTTADFHGFSLRLLGQDVRHVFVDDFNDGTGRPNAKTSYAVVADPSATDLLEGYIGYRGADGFLQGSSVKLGRQIITYRDAPFHRFMGTVLWRQNWQNHDAFTFRNTALPDTTINYAYSWNVNRIFTDHAVASAKANFDSDSHFINVRYTGLGFATLEGYSYLLDFENAATSSTATYGARIEGSWPLSERVNLLYAGEYAAQDDYGNNPASVNEDYYLAEAGIKFSGPGPIKTLVLKVDYEVLSGNGSVAFQTPLATGHAFQGWNDRFLVTPADGINDTYITAVIKAFGANFIAVYHMISADRLGYDYGDELDLLLEKTFTEHYTLGAKIGFYDASRNASNIARGGNLAADVVKTWIWAQLSF